MPAKTLDEYLKQTTVHTTTKQKQQTTRPKYKIIGFYKETEFQETPIGKIPKDWQLVKLDEVTLMIKTGPFGSQLKKTELTNEGIKVYTQENVLQRNFSIGNLYVSIEKFKQLRSFEVKPGDVLLTIRGTVGKAVVVPEHIERGIIHTNLAILRVNKEKLLPQFLEKIINDSNIFIRQIKSSSSSTTLPALYAKTIKMLRLPLPPLEEQWGIAEVLSTVDRAIEKTEELIERLERLKKALMQELLTKGIGHKEYKQTPIGKIPKEWKVIRIKDIATFIKRGKTPKYGNSEVIVIKTAHNYPDKIKFEEAPHAHPDFLKRLPKQYYLKPNDILINSTGTGSVGRVGFFSGYHKPCTVDGHITILRVKQVIVLPKFVFYYLSSPQGYRILEAKATGSTNQIELYVNEIASIPIPLPPLEEQQKIVNILTTIDKWIEFEKKRKKKLGHLKRGLMNLLLTGRVRVKVVKQDASTGSSR